MVLSISAPARPAPPQFNNQLPSFKDIQHWNTRILRRLDAAWDGLDPDAVDPTFDEEFAACRARWPRFYKQGPLDRT